jgi:hypothetical protein
MNQQNFYWDKLLNWMLSESFCFKAKLFDGSSLTIIINHQ